MVSREKKKSPAGGDGASLLRTVSTGAGGLEGPTVRMINAHALRQFRADPADRALVLPHVRVTSVRASLASCEVLHWTETPGPHQRDPHFCGRWETRAFGIFGLKADCNGPWINLSTLASGRLDRALSNIVAALTIGVGMRGTCLRIGHCRLGRITRRK